jgi:tRNA G18 (ribose-2'-O)-methylase SpoU
MEELGRKSVEEFHEAHKFPVIAVLENIRSAYNVGSVFRTADAFLIESVYLVGYTAFPPHKEIRKTALGAEETVTWRHFRTTKEAIQDLKDNGYTVLAAEQTDNSMMLQQVNWESYQRVAIVFGNEVTGVENDTLAACDGYVEIPQMGMKHSLNIATSAGVVLWEIIRGKTPVK